MSQDDIIPVCSMPESNLFPRERHAEFTEVQDLRSSPDCLYALRDIIEHLSALLKMPGGAGNARAKMPGGAGSARARQVAETGLALADYMIAASDQFSKVTPRGPTLALADKLANSMPEIRPGCSDAWDDSKLA